MSVRVERVTKFYGTQKALDNISFEINSGEVVGFLGPNGAGKSTMMKLITGFLYPDNGEVWVNNLSVKHKSIAIKQQIGYLPEHNPLYLDLYVREYLRFAAEIYRLPNVRRKVEEMIEMTGLAREAHKKIGALSKGYRQRVGLAQALIHNPKVLILDEPTSGLDPAQLVEIRQLIKNISSDKTVMLSTHIMQEVEALCSRIIVINQGKIVSGETPANIHAPIANSGLIPIVVEFLQPVDEALLLSIPGISKVKPLINNQWLLTANDDECRITIFNFAVNNKLVLKTLSKQEDNLEKRFLEMLK
jgi:ABC-2 type transport system ATP-binding protein